MAGIYIHIPFCKQACHYCDFHFSTTLKNKDALLHSIINEIEWRKDYLSSSEIKSIYLGGGTPSLLSETELMYLFENIYNNFVLTADAEITLEANPDDLTIKKIKELKHTPINRFSIGIQSFFDEDLKLMNRAHNSSEALRVVQDVQDAGFENITIDLIYGIPTLSNKNWLKNLRTAFNLDVNHISAYCLTVEPKTALAHLVKKGEIENVNEQKSAEQFEMMLQEMRNNNFEQYEISNFAKNEHYSVHNSNYWLKEHYLGIGPSAHSFNGISRQWNISNNNSYIQALSAVSPKREGLYEIEQLTTNQQYNEYVLTSLRTKWGSNLNYIAESFGKDYLSHCIKESEKYLLSKDVISHNDNLHLSDSGKLIADKIASDLFMI